MPARVTATLVIVLTLIAAACASTSGGGDTDERAGPGTGEPATEATVAPDTTTAGTGQAPNEPGQPTVSPRPTPVLEPLQWSACGTGIECAELRVPLDHADPTGTTIGLALARRPARDPDQRIGALLVNPGGPGASGVNLAISLNSLDGAILDRFDIVGWDPRGVRRSEALGCNDDLLDFYRLDPSPDSPDEADELNRAAAAAASACELAAGDRLAHLTTDDTVADLDLIRRALGEDQISYLGYSYGTLIGLRYAEAHGSRVRAMVLDGVFDPTQPLTEWLTDQALAAEDVPG